MEKMSSHVCSRDLHQAEKMVLRSLVRHECVRFVLLEGPKLSPAIQISVQRRFEKEMFVQCLLVGRWTIRRVRAFRESVVCLSRTRHP